MRFTCMICLILMMITACKTKNIPYPEKMKTDLKVMYKKDQDIQNLIINTSNEKVDKSELERKKYAIFKTNCSTLKNYFEEYGYPTINHNGKKISHTFWLLVQHCDHDIDFQKSVLKAMKSELKNNNVAKVDYAYLYDRVQINNGKKQLYGTQVGYDENYNPYIKELMNPSTVNKRRKAMGLNTIEEYIEEIRKIQTMNSKS